jgi:hypothetical protein
VGSVQAGRPMSAARSASLERGAAGMMPL